MIKYFTLLTALLLSVKISIAQDTFSICAIDPLTGEVGSAGASCVNDCTILTDVHPGYGVIHTQASWLAANQNYARTLMDLHLPPQAIIDSLVLHDAQNNPTIRQYGIVDLTNGGRVAAYTGVNCLNYKNHITGLNYSIQGNILLGQQILDSMQIRFLNTPGTLAAKLMAAMQGAKVVGADSRCASWNTSSKSAFIKIARPGDSPENIFLDLKVLSTPFGRDPIDSLQVLFNNYPITYTVILNVKLIIEGLYSTTFNQLSRKDTVKIFLRNAYPPFALVDSASGTIDSLSYSKIFNFNNATSGTYYLTAKHFNSIETWSKTGGENLYPDGTIYNYDFTTSYSQAYGNNLKVKGSKYCLYSGDVNQDGLITLFDVITIYNDAVNFVNGRFIKTDLTGDNIVDLIDVALGYNNSASFINLIRP